jgi:hypothetical protein
MPEAAKSERRLQIFGYCVRCRVQILDCRKRFGCLLAQAKSCAISSSSITITKFPLAKNKVRIKTHGRTK